MPNKITNKQRKYHTPIENAAAEMLQHKYESANPIIQAQESDLGLVSAMLIVGILVSALIFGVIL